MTDSSSSAKIRLSLSDVAKGVGISPQNLHKTYVKKGKIAVSRDQQDKPYIELVEVLRVFGPRFRLPVDGGPVDTVDAKPVDEKVYPVDVGLSELINQNAELQARNSDFARQLKEKNELLREAKEREERLWGQVDKLTDTIKLIEGPKVASKAPETPATAEKKPGWLSRLFGS